MQGSPVEGTFGVDSRHYLLHVYIGLYTAMTVYHCITIYNTYIGRGSFYMSSCLSYNPHIGNMKLKLNLSKLHMLGT